MLQACFRYQDLRKIRIKDRQTETTLEILIQISDIRLYTLQIQCKHKLHELLQLPIIFLTPKIPTINIDIREFLFFFYFQLPAIGCGSSRKRFCYLPFIGHFKFPTPWPLIPAAQDCSALFQLKKRLRQHQIQNLCL